MPPVVQCSSTREYCCCTVLGITDDVEGCSQVVATANIDAGQPPAKNCCLMPIPSHNTCLKCSGHGRDMESWFLAWDDDSVYGVHDIVADEVIRQRYMQQIQARYI